jgi:hypothetical protein
VSTPTAPDAADEQEAIVAVLRECDDAVGWTNLVSDEDALVYECACGDQSPVLAREWVGPAEVWAAADWHRAHVADRLVALGEQQGTHSPGETCAEADERFADAWTRAQRADERLAEVEAERDRLTEALRDMTIRADERRVMCDERDALVTKWHDRAERAEADLAAAEQRGAEKALHAAADALGHIHQADTVPAPIIYRWLRDRADRLGTQAEGEA